MSTDTYRNWIRIDETSGSHDIAHADQGIEWKFPVSYKAEGPFPSQAFVQVGPDKTTLTGGEQTITGNGRLVSYSWERGTTAEYFHFLGNPYDKVTVYDKWPVKAIVSQPNNYGFEFDGAPSNVGSWHLDIGVFLQAGGSAKQISLLLDGAARDTLPQGRSTFPSLAARSVGVAVANLKGMMKIGYTLNWTGDE